MKYIIYSEKGILGFTEAESKKEVCQKLDLRICEVEGDAIHEGCTSYWYTNPGWYEVSDRPQSILVEIIDINELPEISYGHQLEEVQAFVQIR